MVSRKVTNHKRIFIHYSVEKRTFNSEFRILVLDDDEDGMAMMMNAHRKIESKIKTHFIINVKSKYLLLIIVILQIFITVYFLLFTCFYVYL